MSHKLAILRYSENILYNYNYFEFYNLFFWEIFQRYTVYLSITEKALTVIRKCCYNILAEIYILHRCMQILESLKSPRYGHN